jgi:Domain of unknown function (DUF5063)
MNRNETTTSTQAFAQAAKAYCDWATSPPGLSENEEAQRAIELIADLIARACRLGWEEGTPILCERNDGKIEQVRAKAKVLPLQYYSEVFNNLIVPPEEPVTGNLAEDIEDIYRDVALGLELYQQGEVQEAADHWRFWFANHWGEHATSALRALWSHLADRERS